MLKYILIICTMFAYLTANAYSNLTPEERLSANSPGHGAYRSDEALNSIQSSIDQMTDGEDKKTAQIELNERKSRKLLVKCEQAFLKKESSALDICKDYPYDPFECKFISTYMGKLALKNLYSDRVIMKSYYVLMLAGAKKEKEALAELESLGKIVDEKLIIENPNDTLEIVIAAHDLRLQALNGYSKKFPNSLQAKKLKQQYATLEKKFKPIREKYKIKSEDSYASLKVWAANVRAKEAQMNKERHDEKMAELQAHTEKMKNKKYESGYNFEEAQKKSAESASGADSGEGGACTCVKREQYWVAGRSASGLVKAQLGHHEYRDVKVSCPCTK